MPTAQSSTSRLLQDIIGVSRERSLLLLQHSSLRSQMEDLVLAAVQKQPSLLSCPATGSRARRRAAGAASAGWAAPPSAPPSRGRDDVSVHDYPGGAARPRARVRRCVRTACDAVCGGG